MVIEKNMEWMKNRNLASSNSNKKTQYMEIINIYHKNHETFSTSPNHQRRNI